MALPNSDKMWEFSSAICGISDDFVRFVRKTPDQANCISIVLEMNFDIDNKYQWWQWISVVEIFFPILKF